MLQFGNVEGHGLVAEGAPFLVDVFADFPEFQTVLFDFIGNVKQIGLL